MYPATTIYSNGGEVKKFRTKEDNYILVHTYTDDLLLPLIIRFLRLRD